MPLITLEPDAEVPNIDTTTLPDAKVEPVGSIFTALVPESKALSLLKYVEGYPWTVNFYGQIVNTNVSLEHFDPSTPNLTQPYYKVFNLILQVSEPLSSSYDASTGITTVSGAALTPYKILPNAGDIFIAKVDHGEDAIFMVTNVSRKTFRKDTLYEVTYNLYSYTSVNPSFVDNLEERIQQSYWFNKDTNYFNRDVLITPTVKEARDRLETFLRESKKYYIDRFVQEITGSLYIPGVEYVCLDPMLVDFIMKTVELEGKLIRMNRIDTSRISLYRQGSIFDCILDRDYGSLYNISREYVFTSTVEMNNMLRIGTSGYVGVNYIAVPKVIDKKLNIAGKESYPSLTELKDVVTVDNYSTYNIDIVIPAGETIQLLHEMLLDDYYLVSENFYTYLEDSTIRISMLEFLIYKFIRKEAINSIDLAVAIQDYRHWSVLHQLYLLPVLWLIVRNS